MAGTLRIAVLEADTPIDIVKAQCGTYGDIFTKLLKTSCASFPDAENKPELDISKFEIVEYEHYPDLHHIDGVLISGSKHDSFADAPWTLRLVEFIKKAYKLKIPIVGICFGHQVLARALGGTVGRSPNGWEVSVDHIILSPKGEALFGKSSLTLHQMHRDAVLTAPTGCENLGTSPRCEIQGLYLPHRVLSIQAHPEFDDFIMQNILKKRHADGVFTDDLYEDGNLRAKLEHDGALVGVAILTFFMDSVS